MWPCSSGPTTSSGRRWDFSEPSWGSDNPPDALHEPLEFVGQERFHLALVYCGQVVQAPINGGPELLEDLVVGGVQRLLADEPPQPLDQVQVGRGTGQVQQFDPQRRR